MAKTVIRYVSNDGAEWDNELAAEDRDRQIDRVVAITRLLPTRDIQARQYFQHDLHTVKEVKRRLFELAKERELKGYPGLCSLDADSIGPGSMVDRILSECSGPLSKAWSRLCRINWTTGREYQQPYYALRPSEAIEEIK